MEQNKKMYGEIFKEREYRKLIFATVINRFGDSVEIDLADEQNMYFRGEGEAPTAFIAVNIYGDPNQGAFEKLTAELTKIYGEVLGIAPDRIYIKYSTTHDWGWNGNNF